VVLVELVVGTAVEEGFEGVVGAVVDALGGEVVVGELVPGEDPALIEVVGVVEREVVSPGAMLIERGADFV
jgi:hypothetical protein